MESKETPLKNVKVLELGTLIAGPFASKILAEFGAEVIKVESPEKGDPLRNWRILHQDTSLWWYVQSRNKKSLTLNLKSKEGQEIIKKLVRDIDILIENFRPGTLEKWGIGWEDLKKINPHLIMVRVSGYGQSGPYKDKPGFGSIGESMGGLRYLTGYPDRAPVRVGISLGDSLAALYGAIGALMAIYYRDVNNGTGQFIDVALYESVFSVMEGLLPEYNFSNFIRERTGSSLAGIAPSNTYKCSDGKYVIIAGNGDSIFNRLMKAINEEAAANDVRYADNQGRVKHSKEIDKLIENWTIQHTLDQVLEVLDEANVPCGKIYSVEDIVDDPHYIERDMIIEKEMKDGNNIKVPGIVPKLSETPGIINSLGPELGEHNAEILEKLGFDETEQMVLKENGIV
ncbi:CaiB/BaiF CoA-transferase family protein [Bacillus sp. FJAT-50079]|uniref:CaiB/BaiF CoA transferase family protein n=1 Tax=Bacillus sp. FJAT-50079 TaxID=2833577 RepID=UPI001BC907CC|nr:CaiB/BaiF CoA-transferase family protein [Bacillus sp. FJAT-50079]MBS4206629.1 CoA transferase [Bacillus sp. FJAT-50079]